MELQSGVKIAPNTGAQRMIYSYTSSKMLKNNTFKFFHNQFNKKHARTIPIFFLFEYIS